jgi:hypothetical protein|tara:strand:+ start:210 stop:353 length:144 start_codon:yes stop_codon:yes gene_type:complete
MLEKLANYLDICKIHWKEIFALSFIMHFAFDGFILLLGILIGVHIGH